MQDVTVKVHIRQETRDVLQELQRQTGVRQIELLHRAVDHFRRSLVIAETNVAYGRLQKNSLSGKRRWATGSKDD